MKIGVLASHTIQYQAPLFRALALQADVHVFFAHRQSAAAQAKAGFGIPFEWDVDLHAGYSHSFLENRARHPDPGTFWGCDCPAIADAVRAGGFDAFVVMGWHLLAYWQAVRACRRAGVPVLVRGDSHLTTPRGAARRLVKRCVYPWLLRQFDGWLYVGRRNREYLEHYGARAERLFFSPHCIDNEWFATQAAAIDRPRARAALAVAPQELCVLFVGKLLAGKRPADLLGALRAVQSRGRPVRAVFAGDGPLRDELELQARRQQVPVTMLGFCNQSALPSIYAAADVTVLPSESETWGLVVNESLACGTPVVVSDAVGCAPDLVIKSRTGAVYPTGNVAELARALEDVALHRPPAYHIQETIAAYSPEESAAGVVTAARALATFRTEER